MRMGKDMGSGVGIGLDRRSAGLLVISSATGGLGIRWLYSET